ncbi:unnamed protein product [Haemonchus placei]|uniref:CPSF_A domain-containing protein n=1 Tax=Haemonchus placei TaxID=6290 RepID=A0A0N4W385_HAEPC|nr:unnamed protein product [Haemonchus placei]
MCNMLLETKKEKGNVDLEEFPKCLQLRLPENVNEDIQEDPTALRSLWDRGLLNGASQKVDQVAVFYTGDLVTSLQKTSLVPGANECVIYTTIGGAIGILVPFISKDVSNGDCSEFFPHSSRQLIHPWKHLAKF